MYEITQGSRYTATRHLDIAEVAKLVRKDLKTAQTEGRLPADATFAVRIDRFSGGQSLDVTLSGMPDAWTYVSPGLEPNYAEYIPAHGGYTEKAQDAMKIVQAMVFRYNYDGSDVQSDYFNVRFYSSVKIQDQREARWAQAEKERKASARAARAHWKAVDAARTR